ncbi:hypothetical protein GQ600_16410 [Phytophthora cactorum]|nr:hypothetical protein GQ600_16410 [Phytophthora cactorum]
MHAAEGPPFFGNETGDLGVILSFGDDEWGPQLLLETLDEAIGDFDAGLSTVGLPTISPAPNTTQKETKRRRKQLKPNNARDERRFQVTQLRKEVEDLELTLKQWQEIRSKQRFPAGVSKTDRSGNNAERENIRLKNQCKDEMQVVKKIEKLLYKRLIQRNRLSPISLRRALRGIEVCYRLEESVLGATTSIPANMASRMPLLRGGLKGEERLLDRRILPFSVDATGKAWWRDWHSYRGHTGENPGNMVVESFGVEMNDFKTNTSVTSYGQQILRRDVEDNRIVFVWNSYLEPFIFENEQVGGIYFLEQCHMIIKPEDEDTATNDDELASCIDPRAAALIDFLVGALFIHMKAHNDMVEDLLLDQLLQKHSNK